MVIPVAFLWFILVNQLRNAWSADPQYSYGFIVPLLCLGLLFRRWQAAENQKSEMRDQKSTGSPTPVLRPHSSVASAKAGPPPGDSVPKPSTCNLQPATPSAVSALTSGHRSFSPLVLGSFGLLAFLLLPLRLILEANPDWRLLNWLLALDTVALTLLLVQFVSPPARSPLVPWSLSPWSLARRPWSVVSGPWSLLSPWVLHFAFPIAFILVAVPWPFSIERPVIQGLTRSNVAFVLEALSWIGIPAAQHGNVIEIATGTVGVDEACSGIRSLQSSIMISLFLGEFFRLGLWRRLLLVPLGFLVAFGFNACRTTILTWIAAKKGVGAIAQYHDGAGLTILLACTATLWLIAWLMHFRRRPGGTSENSPTLQPWVGATPKRMSPEGTIENPPTFTATETPSSPPSPLGGEGRGELPASSALRRQSSIASAKEDLSAVASAKAGPPSGDSVPKPSTFNLQPATPSAVSALPSGDQVPVPSSPLPSFPPVNALGPISAFCIRISALLFVWLLFVEISVEVWYRLHESRAASIPVWTVPWPPPFPRFTEVPISEKVCEILGYDEGHSGRWQTDEGANWTINYFRWDPGKQQAWLSGIHRPEICMAAMGQSLREQEPLPLTFGSVELPFQLYTYEQGGGVLYVFHCFWERRSGGRNSTPVEPSKSQRLRTVLEGQRNLGQQTLQLSVRGMQDKAEATKSLVSQLRGVLRTGTPSVSSQ